MRRLTESELSKLKFLTSNGVEVVTIEPTSTGLEKSIFDATQPLRDFLNRNNVHNYLTQKQGQDSKVVINSKIITSQSVFDTNVSLYRPTSKSGDPRIWFSGIKSHCIPSDIIGIFYFNNELWIFNLTKISLVELQSPETPFFEIISAYNTEVNEVSSELLSKLNALSARGFIRSTIDADTAIGRLLETELGIDMNSKKTPDYKGIEIKSYRSKRSNRKNLFAQVPNWQLSKYKSSKQILDAFGYQREGIHRLYCTVNSTAFNPQGLKLKVDEKNGLLIEFSNASPQERALVWEMGTLNSRLQEKHAETFWIEADVDMRNGTEWFKFVKVEHTKKPILSQLGILLDSGSVTLDHLIKEKGQSAVEKGPIFKLKGDSLSLLFPPSLKYDLG